MPGRNPYSSQLFNGIEEKVKRVRQWETYRHTRSVLLGIDAQLEKTPTLDRARFHYLRAELYKIGVSLGEESPECLKDELALATNTLDQLAQHTNGPDVVRKISSLRQDIASISSRVPLRRRR